MIRVKATREGLIGHKTASGYVIDAHVPFVALPASAALRQWVKVRNPANGLSLHALVLDVGPWNTNDNEYVFQGATEASSGYSPGKQLSVGKGGEAIVDFNTRRSPGVRPQAEAGTSVSGVGTNGAGIDLGEKVWNVLQLTDNAEIEWEFL